MSTTPDAAPGAVPAGAHGPLDLPVDEVRTLLAERYDLRPQRLDYLEGELSTICRFEVAGRRLVVKVNVDTDDARAALEWRVAVMGRLAAQGLPVAGIHPDRAGDLVSTATAGGTPVMIVVEHWLEGVPLSAASLDEATLVGVGSTAARLSSALGSVPPPPPGLTHSWELSRTRETILHALPDVHDEESHALAARAADAFAAEVEPLLSALPRAVVHQDLHDDNILIGPVQGRQRVVGILDFGDMIVGLRVAELAIAACYAARLTPDPLDGFLSVVRGWGRESSLTDDEAAVVFPLARARLAANVAVWAARSSGTRASYAAARSARSLTPLRALLAADADRVAVEVRRLAPA